MHQYGSKYFAHRPPPWTLGRIKRLNFTSLERGNDAYYNKGIDECSNFQAHILSLNASSTSAEGSKVKTLF